MSGHFSVPGEFFDDHQYPADDGYDSDDEYDDRMLELLDGVPGQHASRPAEVATDRLSASIKALRYLATQLRGEGHPLAHVPAQIANVLMEVRAPTPPPVGGGGGQAESPTGNCRICGQALPLPSMGRGRPRTLCERCSPKRG